MNILVDMNLSPTWTDFLTGAGFSAVHWSMVGAPDATDRALAVWAAERGYVVLTADLGFAALLAATGSRRPSVITIRSDLLTPESVGSAVLEAIHKAKEELADGAIISVDADRARGRVLPLPGR
jgi:predicted nuclease of predicted toxin-antitoxin system